MEDDLNGRKSQLKTTSMKDDLIEDDFNLRWPQLKMTSMEDDLNGRRPKWKTKSMNQAGAELGQSWGKLSTKLAS